MAVINGTNSANTLNGTVLSDTISGFGGGDTLNGNAGNDTLNGGAGDDTLNGGEHSDTYIVGPGDGFDKYTDTGLTGFDRIRATANDTVIGIRGSFSASNGIEQIDGDGRSGVIIRGDSSGNIFDFSLVSLTWIAQIDGGAGADTITGSSGNDAILGGTGNDGLNGGEGSDTYLYGAGDGRDIYADTGASGMDRIVATAGNLAITLSATFGPATGIEEISAGEHTGVILQGTGSVDTLDFSVTLLTGIASIEGGGGVDTITGSAGDDTIVGGTANDSLDGGNGSDTYLYKTGDGRDLHADSGASGTDRILAMADNTIITLPSVFGPASGIEEISADGHSGVIIEGTSGSDNLDFSAMVLTGIERIEGGGSGDAITGSAGDDTILGENGTDTVQGAGGDDMLHGGSGADILYGEGAAAPLASGDDTLIGGSGDDFLDGGNGSDTYVYNPDDDRDIYADSGASGTDRIVVTADNMAITLRSVFQAANGIEEISANGHSGVSLEGTSGSDMLDFSSTVLTGITVIDARGGDDAVTGSSGDDTILGGYGDDAITGAQGNDMLHGGSGVDTLKGDDPSGVFAGNDTLIGGTGNDMMDGGGGSDTYLYAGGDGRDTYTDTGTSGTDRIVVTEDDTELKLQSGFGSASGIEEINANGHSGVTIEGSVYDDTLDFSQIALKGIDSINTGSGADSVIGSAGNDTINGGSGSDLIKGGAGNDTINGESNFDTAVYDGAVRDYQVIVTSASAGQGKVVDLAPTTDGNDGTDTLNSIQAIQFSDYTIYLKGFNNAVLAADDAVAATVNTVAATVNTPVAMTAASLTANDFDFDGNALKVIAVNGAVNGTVVLNPDSTILFTPAPGFSGEATFDYVVSDGHGSTDTGHVTLMVSTANALPVFISGTAAAVAESVADGAVIYDAEVSDPDGAAAVFTLEGTDAGLFSIDASTGEVRFIVPPDFEAPQDDGTNNVYDIVIRANDSVNQVTQAVAVSVTDVADTAVDTTASTPILTVQTYNYGAENAVVPLVVSAELADTDGSETLEVTAVFDQMMDPWGAILSDGVNIFTVTFGNTTADITGWTLSDLTITPPANSDRDFSFVIKATSTEANGGASTERSELVILTVATDGTGVQHYELEDLIGLNGFRMDAPIANLDGDEFTDYPEFGQSVSMAGDINGDGFDDIIVGAFGVSPSGEMLYAGASYVVFGCSGIPSVLDVDDLNDLNGMNGFRLVGLDEFDNAGRSVSGGGDINGDGFDDIIVGAPSAGANEAGEAYVIFGHGGMFSPTVSVSTGLALSDNTSNSIGFAVSNAGDVNGDGVSDLIVANPNQAYVVYGGASLANPLANPFDLSAMTAAHGFFTTSGGDYSVSRTYSVSGAGDINGDGFDDIILGEDTYGGGSAYVIFGGPGGAMPSVDLTTLTGTNGFQLTVATNTAGMNLGRSVSSAGDVNGDGFDDLIIGAPYSKTHGDVEAGISYLVYGKDGGFSPVFEVDLLNGTVRIDGGEADDHLGIAVSSAGDVNADGYDDIIVATQYGGNTLGSATSPQGQTYLLFGKAGGLSSTIDLASLSAEDGVRLDGGYMISSVSAAGDINGDGFGDIMIGAPNIGLDQDAASGVTYVIYGGLLFQDPASDYVMGDAIDNELSGTGSEIVMGNLGNDVLRNGAVLNGGAGDDTFDFSSGSKIVGGSGFDTLKVSGDLNLTTLNATAHYGQITGVEQIDMTGESADTLTFEAADLFHLSDEQNVFYVRGDSDDTVDIGAGWAASGSQDIDETGFNIYVLGVTTLFVQDGIETFAA